MDFLRIIYNSLNQKYAQKKARTPENLKKYAELQEYCKDKKRCFVIGNGPSLRKEDLDRLENEVTFVSNRFFNIYSGWLPTVYFCQDPTVLKSNLKQIKEYPARFKILNPHIKNPSSACKDAILYSVDRYPYLHGYTPYMSENFAKGLCDGYTVTYAMLQTAVLLGFQEIYMLGVDFNYVIKDGKIDESSYPPGIGKVAGGLPNLNYNLQAYSAASEHCQRKGIRLVNLSRQTKLEVIPRREFESIWDGE